MRAAVDDVHHRDRKRAGVHAAEISIERDVLRGRSSARRRHGHGENGVCAEAALVGRGIEIDHDLVDRRLQARVVTDQGLADRPVDVRYGFARAFAEIAILIVIAQFVCFVLTRRSAAGHGGAACAAVGQKHFGFDRGIPTRVQNLDPADFDDGRHFRL